MTIDWELYQKCPVCAARIGEPCFSISGSRSQPGQVHSTRKLRAAAARAGGDC